MKNAYDSHTTYLAIRQVEEQRPHK